ncbi:MAG: hypothetical protein AAFU03_13595, partial [Bacteroidota bacterium]
MPPKYFSSLFFLGLLLLGSWNHTTAQESRYGTLYLLTSIINDPNDIATKGARKDQKFTRETFEFLADYAEMKFEYVDLGFGKDGINRFIESETFAPTDQDVVVFLFTGHGIRFKKSTSRWPLLLCCPEETLTTAGRSELAGCLISVEEIYNKIKAKGPRLSITVANSCNNVGKDKEANIRQKLNHRPSTAASTEDLTEQNQDNI